MKRKLYGNSIAPLCEVCVHGRRAADDRVILCIHKGVTQMTDRCRKFSYDPLRRIPYRQPEHATYTEADFAIDFD
jgi:hypothetical protein